MEIKNLRYNRLGTIDIELNHPHFGWIPFTTSPDDPESFGRDIYNQCITGTYGPIQEYIPVPELVPSADDNKEEAEKLLKDTDWINQPDVYDSNNTPHLLNRSSYLEYRSIIRQIAVTPTEGKINWPTKPTAIWSN